jgi:hypothetical protein
MNLGLAAGVIAGSVATLVALMLVVRRRSPAGGWFKDSERAAGVFGFLGAGYAILLGFVILISFQSYANARTKSEDEATAVFEQFQAAALFAPSKRQRVQGELVCYGRSVVFSEWPRMKNGHASPLTESWIEQIAAEVPRGQIATMQANQAYTQWFEESRIRDEGRRERLLESQQPLPSLLWVLLILGAAVLVVYMLFFADSGERPVVQAMMMGGVTALVVASLLAVTLLASPFENQNGSIKPKSMRYTLALISKEIAQQREQLRPPCGAHGVPAV